MTALSREDFAAGTAKAAGSPPSRSCGEPRKPPEHGTALLRFAVDTEGRTYLASQFARYPHHLTRALYLDRAAPQAATVYLQSLSGGLTQGDCVALRISAASSAIAHITTQAATKVHSMERGFALNEVSIEAQAQSHLEYLADPTICFPHSRLVARTNLSVAREASAIFGESYIWHDPRGIEQMAFGALLTETVIRSADGRLLALDRSRLNSPGGLLGNPALLSSYRAFGTLFAVGRGSSDAAVLSAMRAALAALPGIYVGASLLPAEAGLWIRVLGKDGAALRAAMDRAWRQCHERMLGWTCDRRRK